jgi:hypothetical protein
MNADHERTKIPGKGNSRSPNIKMHIGIDHFVAKNGQIEEGNLNYRVDPSHPTGYIMPTFVAWNNGASGRNKRGNKKLEMFCFFVTDGRESPMKKFMYVGLLQRPA